MKLTILILALTLTGCARDMINRKVECKLECRNCDYIKHECKVERDDDNIATEIKLTK